MKCLQKKDEGRRLQHGVKLIPEEVLERAQSHQARDRAVCLHQEAWTPCLSWRRDLVLSANPEPVVHFLLFPESDTSCAESEHILLELDEFTTKRHLSWDTLTCTGRPKELQKALLMGSQRNRDGTMGQTSGNRAGKIPLQNTQFKNVVLLLSPLFLVGGPAFLPLPSPSPSWVVLLSLLVLLEPEG